MLLSREWETYSSFVGEISESESTLYLRWDRLRDLLVDRLGPTATRPDMARHLGISYVTFWRLTSAKGGRRHPCGDSAIRAIRAAFPDVPDSDLFDADTDRPRRVTRPEPERPKAEEFHTVAEVARMWRCSPDHIYRLIARRELAYLDIGIGKAKIRIAASALVDYKAKNENEPDGAKKAPRRSPVGAGQAA